jgi:acyl carrier protein
MTSQDTTTTPTQEQVLAQVTGMINKLLEAYGELDAEVEMNTLFHDDLEMESIDLVTLAGMLVEAYGPAVNLAEYLAEKDLDEVIGMTIGDVVRYVCGQIERD